MGYTLGLYWDNGKENGNYCLGLRVSWDSTVLAELMNLPRRP